MSRAVVYETFGGPEVLELREVPEPHAGPGEVRVRVTAAGLNPMDWGLASRPEAAARFGITLPSGFGYDFAGVVDEVGAGATGFAVGDRVYGGALGRAVADFVVVKVPAEAPDALSYAGRHQRRGGEHASGGRLDRRRRAGGDRPAVRRHRPDRRRRRRRRRVRRPAREAQPGPRVIGTAAEGTFGFLRQLGAEPVAYGPGLADRVRALAPGGVTAATDLFGTETAEAALALGVPPERISTIAAGPNPPGGVRATGGVDAEPGRPGADHRRDPGRPDHRADRRGLPGRADPRRRHPAGRAPRPRQDRGHLVSNRHPF